MEIMDRMRQVYMPDIPAPEYYLRYLCAGFTRSTGLTCIVSETRSMEEQAREMIFRLARAGGLLLLDET